MTITPSTGPMIFQKKLMSVHEMSRQVRSVAGDRVRERVGGVVPPVGFCPDGDAPSGKTPMLRGEDGRRSDISRRKSEAVTEYVLGEDGEIHALGKRPQAKVSIAYDETEGGLCTDVVSGHEGEREEDDGEKGEPRRRRWRAGSAGDRGNRGPLPRQLLTTSCSRWRRS